MSRYFIRPIAWQQDMPETYELTAMPSVTVFPAEARDTGLVDAAGNKIMAGVDPIGFLR